MKKKLIIAVAVIAFFIALAATLYPLIADRWNAKHQSEVQVEYQQQMENLEDETRLEALSEAEAYNESLRPVKYNQAALNSAATGYDDLLNLYGNGIMAYVEIPKIKVNLPVYHGTSTEILEKGVGHLLGSSLPIGGLGNHAVLTGHSGVAGQRLFSDLDKLSGGDVFYVHVLNQKLAYEVKAIDTVLPTDTNLLTSVADKDKCTLITCTPFGINTHRLLVQGERIEIAEAEEIVEQEEAAPVESTWETEYWAGVQLGGEILASLLMIAVAVIGIRKWRKNDCA